MPFICRITKARTQTHTHTKYLKIHLAFSMATRLHITLYLRIRYMFCSVYTFLFFCLSASVYVIQCISPHQQAGHTCAPQSEKNSTVATTGSDTNTVNQMQPEFFIFPYIVGARKENRVVACVVGVANFVVCGKGTKL